jgi:molybdopterin converting factor subunit 1
MARLLFFGKLGDLAGKRARDFALPAGLDSLHRLIDALSREDETLGAALKEKHVRFAVNEKIVRRDAPIRDEDEIAFLPPVSGG